MRGAMFHLIRILIKLVPLALITTVIFGAVGPGPALANSGWTKTGYSNQHNPSAFLTLDSEQTPPGPVAVGGKILTVNKVMVLVPWILVGIAFIIVIIRLVQHFRKKMLSRSPPEEPH